MNILSIGWLLLFLAPLVPLVGYGAGTDGTRKLFREYGLYFYLATTVSAIVVLLIGLSLQDETSNSRTSECAEACAPRVSKFIDEVCHCKTETGWEETP